MAPTNNSPSPKLNPDDVDDLIYACRTNDLESLQTAITHLATQHKTTEARVIQSAIDVDDDGLGAQTCLLHCPAANGNLQIVQYLLQKLDTSNAQTNGSTPTQTSQATSSLVNHQNISGNTPLHWAALNGHLDVVKALVGAGADPTIVNEAGRDAVVEAEYSAKETAVECANWLLKECEVLERGAGMDGEGVGAGENEDVHEDKEDDDDGKGEVNGET